LACDTSIARVSFDEDYITQLLASRIQTYLAETSDRDPGPFF
jgi:hypothetical protein